MKKPIKKLIVCCDGTWNEPEEKQNGSRPPTNVLKMARAIKPSDSEGILQVIYYDAGVGTGCLLGGKLVEGATGFGISGNILEAYRFLANNYEENSQIFCFGFSRGAYTVRALAGLVHYAGLLPKTELERLPEVYKLYRTEPKKRSKSPYDAEINQLIEKTKRTRNPPIHFIGVWDTVGALGVPTPTLGWISRKLWVGFFDTTANNIDYAYQALAIDERRAPFKPSVWSSGGKGCKELKQVWFAGSHSNVGGGCKDSSLSDLALGWMARMAHERGLAIDDEYLRQHGGWRSWNDYGDPLGKLVDSFSAPYRLLKPLPMKWPEYLRPIGGTHVGIDEGKSTPQHGANEMIHQSAIDRYQCQRQLDPAKTLNEANLRKAIEGLPVEPY